MFLHHWAGVGSCGWAKTSACRLQVSLSCAVLCQIVSIPYSSRSSLHRFYSSNVCCIVTRKVSFWLPFFHTSWSDHGCPKSVPIDGDYWKQLHFQVPCMVFVLYFPVLFVVNISMTCLFKVCRSDVFEEMTLELNITEAVSAWLQKEMSHLQIADYNRWLVSFLLYFIMIYLWSTVLYIHHTRNSILKDIQLNASFASFPKHVFETTQFMQDSTATHRTLSDSACLWSEIRGNVGGGRVLVAVNIKSRRLGFKW